MTGNEYYSLLQRSPHKAHKAVFDEYCKYVYTIVFNHLRICGSRAMKRLKKILSEYGVTSQ